MRGFFCSIGFIWVLVHLQLTLMVEHVQTNVEPGVVWETSCGLLRHSGSAGTARNMGSQF